MSACPGCTGDPADHPGDRFEMTFGEQPATPPSTAVPDPADVEKAARAIWSQDVREAPYALRSMAEYRRLATVALTAVRPAPDSERRACPACRRYMDPDHAWWWTAYGSTCSEGCARDLIREHEGGIHRPGRHPMTARHAPAPRYPSRLWLGLMAAAVAGIGAGTVGAAHEIAPKVAADEHLALTPERSAEPVAHGGPLAMPSIGALTSDPPAYLPPVPRPPQRRSAAPAPTLRVTGTPQTTPAPVLSRSVAITGASEPTVTTPTQAATVTTGATTTEAAPTTTEATTSSETTTSETTTTTVSVTVTATESTEEGQ